MQPDELRAARKSAGLSQGELAKELGLSQGYIGEMERGEKAIDKRTALAVQFVTSQRGLRPPSRDMMVEEVDALFAAAESIGCDHQDAIDEWITHLQAAHIMWTNNEGWALGTLLLFEACRRAESLRRPLGREAVIPLVKLDFARLRVAWELVPTSKGA